MTCEATGATLSPRRFADTLFHFPGPRCEAFADGAGNFADSHFAAAAVAEKARDVTLIFREPIGDFQGQM